MRVADLGSICSSSDNIKWKDVPRDKVYKYIDLTSVDRDTKSIIEPQSITADTAPSRAQRIIRQGDILFATTRPTLRRLCVVPPDYDGEICSTGFCVLRPDLSKVLPKWVFILLSTDAFYDYIGPLQTGATYPAVTDKDVRAFAVPVPSLPEQQRIVDILDQEFAKIDALKANAEKSLQAAKDLFQATLKKELEPKEGWKKYCLKDVCTDYGDYGMSLPSKAFDGVRYLRITDITEWGELNNDSVSVDGDVIEDRYMLKDGDVLFARTGATVGKTLIYDPSFGKCCYAGYLIRYRPDKSIVLPRILFFITHSTPYYDWVAKNQKLATLPNISAKLYNGFELTLPSIKEQDDIVSRLDILAGKSKDLNENYQKTLTLCDDLKQSLLRKAFNGEL